MKQIEFPAQLIFHKLCWEFLFFQLLFPILQNFSEKYKQLSTDFPHCLRLFRFEKSSSSTTFCFDFVSIGKRKKTFAAGSFRLHRSFFRHFCKRACINKLATRCNDQSDSVKLQQRLLRPARHLQHNRHLPFVHGIRIPCH